MNELLLLSKKSHNVYFISGITKVIKSRRMRYIGDEAYMG
jgi:hypothetical protein